MADQRLPTVNGDDGAWGDILNEFLGKEHYNGDGDFNPATSENGGHEKITIRAGTATGGTAPLKFTSGTLMTVPEAGAVEFLTDKLYVTNTAGPARLTVVTYNEATGGTGNIYYRDGSGNIVPLTTGTNTHVLTLAGGVPTWAAPAGGGSADYTHYVAIGGYI